MRQIAKKVHKGFTLIEMMIVLALFSLVMYSVVRLLQPVTQFFVRSSNFETTTACVDNMKRAIEGNLKYADRVRVYADFSPYASTAFFDGATVSASDTDYTPSAALLQHVNQMWTEFFMNREFLETEGSIYAMVFDNTVYQRNLTGYSSLSDFTDNRLNAGQILLFEFHFGKTSGEAFDADSDGDGTNDYRAYFKAANRGTGDGEYSVRPWYVNQKMYGNFEYQFSLGNYGVGAGALFDPSSCTVNIEMYELVRNEAKTGLELKETSDHATASFSMKNVLDATNHYATPLNDFKTIRNPTYNPVTDDATMMVMQESLSGMPIPIPRYRLTVKNGDPGTGSFAKFTTTNGTDAVNIMGSTDAADLRPGFYFIYTLPETTHGASEEPTSPFYDSDFATYMAAVRARYHTP